MSARWLVSAVLSVTHAQVHHWPGRFHLNYTHTEEDWSAADFCCFPLAKTSESPTACVSNSYESIQADPEGESMIHGDVRCIHAGYLDVRRLESEEAGDVRRRLTSHECHVAKYCECMENMLAENSTARICEKPCEYQNGMRNTLAHVLWFCLLIPSALAAACFIMALVHGFQPAFFLMIGFGLIVAGAGVRAARSGHFPAACAKVMAGSVDAGFLMLGLGAGLLFAVPTFFVVREIGPVIAEDVAKRIASARGAFRQDAQRARDKRLMYERAKAPGTTRIWLQMLSGESVALDVDPGDTTEFVAIRIHACTGIAPECQRLVFQGTVLAASSQDTMEHCGVGAGARLQLLIEDAPAADLSSESPPRPAAGSLLRVQVAPSSE